MEKNYLKIITKILKKLKVYKMIEMIESENLRKNERLNFPLK